MRTNLQVPITKTVRDDAARVAAEYGFSSLQEAVRIFLTQLSQRKVDVRITPQFPDEVLSSEQEAVLTEKYHAAQKERAAGADQTASSANDLVTQLDRT